MSNDREVLLGLSSGELEALAEGMLAPSIQARLDDLIAQSKQRRLSSEETVELDRLLARVDYLTLVKTRARYTLRNSRPEWRASKRLCRGGTASAMSVLNSRIAVPIATRQRI